MKKIDKLLLSSFVGPFVVAFGVALFVLIMQFLWLYIDEIAGKGISIFVMLELIGYLSVSTFPWALPIAVLIASVMVMGNLAERYELSSMKSAGVSLLRVMAPIVFVCAGVSVFSYVCSDFLIPIANLKFRTRLFDIRKQKPALSIEKGVFNEDFRQFIIRVADKEKDGETIKDVLIEDQTTAGKIKFNQILADSGQMYTTEDKRFFVMNLFRGVQYQEPTGNSGQQKQKFPFVRTKFNSWSKVWDLREFEMTATDDDKFKTQRGMLSISQLKRAVDSIYVKVDDGFHSIKEDLVLNAKRVPIKPQPAKQPGQAASTNRPVVPVERTSRTAGRLDTEISKPASSTSTTATKVPKPKPVPPSYDPSSKDFKPIAIPQTPNQVVPPSLTRQQLDKPLKEYSLFLETFPVERQKVLVDDAIRQLKLSETNLESRKGQISKLSLEAVKTGYELYSKYSFAIICLLFAFIGCPLGAIIRKGGFGYPVLISIIFFVIFVFLTILCRKLAETYIMTAFWAAMMPWIILVPVALVLTNRALKDGQLFSTERIEQFIRWISSKIQKKQSVVASNS